MAGSLALRSINVPISRISLRAASNFRPNHRHMMRLSCFVYTLSNTFDLFGGKTYLIGDVSDGAELTHHGC